MSVNRLRTEGNERVDLGDYQYQTGEGLNLMAENTPGNVLTNPLGQRAWILDGFAMTNPSGAQLTVTKGRAVLSRREGGNVTHGMVTTEGDATKTLDLSAFALSTFGVFIRFEYVDSDTLSRVFWDPSGQTEFSQNIDTRRQANWSVRVELTSPGAEWFKIGEVTVSGGPAISIADQRDFYFEGKVSDTFANTWGSGLDRDADRAANGVKDAQTFTRAVRQLFEDIKPAGRRWWELSGLERTGTSAGESGVKGTGGSGNSIGVEGIGTGTGAAGAGGHFTGGTGAPGVFATNSSNGQPAVDGLATGDGDGVRGESQGAGIGVLGTTTAAGSGVEGSASNAATGDAVLGEAGTGGGVGVKAVGDNSATPVRSAFAMDPQDTDPSTGFRGDFLVLSATGKLRGHDGDVFARYRPFVFQSVVDATPVASTTAETVLDQFYTIPANTLAVGSTLRLLAHGTASFAATPLLELRLRWGGISGQILVSQAIAVSGAMLWSFDIEMVFHVVGGTPTIRYNRNGALGPLPLSPTLDSQQLNASAALDTTVAQDLVWTAEWSVSSASNIARMLGYALQIS